MQVLQNSKTFWQTSNKITTAVSDNPVQYLFMCTITPQDAVENELLFRCFFLKCYRDFFLFSFRLQRHFIGSHHLQVVTLSNEPKLLKWQKQESSKEISKFLSGFNSCFGVSFWIVSF